MIEKGFFRIPDPMSGLRAFLIKGLVKADWLNPAMDWKRVFIGGIPKKYIDGHQKNAYTCMCINPTGYPEDGSEAPRSTIRVEMVSYGDSFEEASDIDLAVYALLKPLRGCVVEFEDRELYKQSIYIYVAIPSGPIFSRDPDLDWACVSRSYRIRFGERNMIEA